MHAELNPRDTPVSDPDNDAHEAPSRPRKRRKRWRRVIVILLILAGIGGCTQWMGKMRNKPLDKPLKEALTPERATVEERLLESGTVELRTTVEVKSKMSGKVQELLVEVGDLVKEGQVLAVIEPDPNEILRLYQKRAAVEARLIDLQEVTREFKRSTQLHEKGVLPGDQFEKIRDQVKAADTHYQLALLELQALEREMNPGEAHAGLLAATSTTGTASTVLSTLTDVRVLSPMTGLVIKRPAEKGELVISGTATTIAGTTLLELGDPDDVVIRASVNEVDISRVLADQKVDVTLSAYDEEHFLARVRRLSPIGITPQGKSVVSFSVEVQLDEPDARILPGMSCDLDIVVEQQEDVLSLPHHALFQEMEKEEDMPVAPPGTPSDKNKTEDTSGKLNEDDEPTYLDYVWVQVGEDWEKREVELGLKGSKRVEILSGISESDAIYPDAEHMRWYVDESERRAQKGWRLFKRGKSKSGTDEAASKAS